MGRMKEQWAEQRQFEERVSFERAEAAYLALEEVGLTEVAERLRQGGSLAQLGKDELLFVVERLVSEPKLGAALRLMEVHAEDINELNRRKLALMDFEKLLTDDVYFENCQKYLKPNARPEDVWQDFVETNIWILGYGLNYVLNAPLEGKKLEQVVKGYDVASSGKRVDSLLKSQGLVNTLSFGEIKTHKTPLLKRVADPYRSEAWQVSDEVTGAIAQLQRGVQKALYSLSERLEPKDGSGERTGEKLYLYRPRSFLLIGSLSEFQGKVDINEDKFSSFELFRRNLSSPEILTFDELFERARHIVAVSS
ncbi:DUF4263 domain-containing protein [Allopusillimonas soli]|uniref:DUF4263 domain-containing protein n=1 Tax=Allopusillimonas soli TaxID=659016 RepID=A0A853F8A2_9BURK|nr:Shedu immune nuclease family protein [Allopusillimonas soli]NYT35782.1 DUF4263 domain-containing protein [Allopusillimonas soli]TEA76159.1 DUF4263 domain-containing protein [Allopusillimonas soli]